MEAMLESHNAEISYINAKIAPMTAGSVPPAGVTTSLVGSAEERGGSGATHDKIVD